MDELSGDITALVDGALTRLVKEVSLWYIGIFVCGSAGLTPALKVVSSNKNSNHNLGVI